MFLILVIFKTIFLENWDGGRKEKEKIQGKHRKEGTFPLLNFYSLSPDSGDYSNYLTVQKKMGALRAINRLCED